MGDAGNIGRVAPEETPSLTRGRKSTNTKVIPIDALPTPSLAAKIFGTLQTEKAQLTAQLSSMTRERDTLLRDRQQLEEENERLRLASLEKDRQLAELLTRC